MKKQVVVIGGGDSFDRYKDYLTFLKEKDVDSNYFKAHKDWKGALGDVLGKNFEVFSLSMPNKNNARYVEWKIWFERVIPFLKNDVVLIGQSLGGMFLAKYLATTTFPKKIPATFLVSAPYGGGKKESLSQFKLPPSLSKFEKQSGKIYIIHSHDDPLVPFDHAEKYKKVLPDAKVLIFKNRGHFNTDSFPEIVKLIKK